MTIKTNKVGEEYTEHRKAHQNAVRFAARECLDPTERLLLHTLNMIISDPKKNSWSLIFIMENCGFSDRKNTSKRLNDLEEKGWLSIERSPKGSRINNRYKLLIPESYSEAVFAVSEDTQATPEHLQYNYHSPPYHPVHNLTGKLHSKPTSNTEIAGSDQLPLIDTLDDDF